MNITTEKHRFPVHEMLRLAALESYGILDTSPEQQFDTFVTHAARKFNAPISSISLVDNRRQWFKARIGLPVSQTDREHAFCTHVIDAEETLVVRDATRDARFAGNPLVTGGPRIRFYAGAPLITPLKRCLGTLNVIDTITRPKWSDADTAMLEAMANAVMATLEQRRANLVIQRALGDRPN